MGKQILEERDFIRGKDEHFKRTDILLVDDEESPKDNDTPSQNGPTEEHGQQQEATCPHYEEFVRWIKAAGTIYTLVCMKRYL